MEILRIDPSYNFLISSGNKISSKRLSESFLKKSYPEKYEEIMDYGLKIGINERPFNEKVYHRIYNLKKVLCENCQEKIPKFLDFKRGYSRNCSTKCSNNSILVQSKKEETCIKNYGVKNPSNSKIVTKKIQETFEEKYGGNPFSLKGFQERIKKTNLIKYGAEQIRSKGSSYWNEEAKRLEEEFREKYKDLEIITYSPDKWGECTIKCNQCKEIYSIPKYNLHQRILDQNNTCTICNPMGSSNETAIENFIENILIEFDINYIKKDRKFLGNGKEIDFLISDKKLAIEVNGIYWHSSRYIQNNYHLEKTEICLKNGFKLIHIFEDEILFHPDLIKSRLRSIFGLVQKNIYARKCIINEIDSKEGNDFLEKNHIQGRCASTIRYGLFFENVLVSMMTFGKLRKSLGSSHKEGYWELVRFCSLQDTNVIGGASKLIKYFINEKSPISIESFCDRRWSPDGGFYEKLGFELANNGNPNYWYYGKNSYQRKHRYTFRKDVLIKEGFDKSKTESEIMEERGFLKVYDCGSSKWVMKIK